MGESRATQAITVGEGGREELGEILQLLKKSMNDLQLEPQQESDLRAEIQTMESQMTSSRPKRGIIIESLNSVRTILESATGSLIASGFLTKIAAFLDGLL